MKLTEHMKQLSKKQKMTIVTVAILVVLGGSFGYKVYADGQEQKQISEAKTFVDKQVEELEKLQTEINSLYVEKDFLNKNVTNESVKVIDDKIKKVEDKHSSIVYPKGKVKTINYETNLSKCKTSLENVQLKLTVQNKVNSFFEKDVIVGNELLNDVAIKNDLKLDAVEKVKKEFLEKISISKDETIVIDEKKVHNEYEIAIIALIDNAENQVKQIEKAKQAVEKVFKDNKVINADSKNYDSAKSEVDKIKNQKVKKELSDKLAKVKVDIDAKVKAETEKKEQEKAVEVAKTLEESKAINNEVGATNQGTSNNESVGNGGNNQDYQGYPTNNNAGAPSGGNSGGNGASSGNGENTGGQTGGNQGGGTTQPPVTPPTEPTGPPPGWITPKYPIGSLDLENWIMDNGYSGYFISGQYIQPY